MCGVRPPGRVSGKGFAATTVVVGSGLPTAPLEALETLRKKKSNGSFTLFGWKGTWIMRRSGTGDMCMVDPANGNKIHSVVGLKR